jgi:MFS family permease
MQPDGPTLSSPPSEIPTDQPARRIYQIGTLRYTLAGLVILFSWLLMADFVFSLMEYVIPKILPLTLQEIGASNATIGLLVVTLSSGANLILNPIISFRSDRYRSKWGRRRPYLIWSAPFISIFLIITGYSHDIGHWFHSLLAGKYGSLSQGSVILGTIAVACVAFQFFNMFVRSVYYYLLYDVVPQKVIGRFYALFRIVDAGAGYVFNSYLLGYADNPLTRKWIYVSMGILYLVAFILMCWNVKEGEYPPPEPLGEGSWIDRTIAAIRVYIRDCFSVRLFWWMFLGNAFYRATEVSIFNFQLLLAKDLGMTLDRAGQILGWTTMAGVILYGPLGWLCDKIHAMRLVLISAVMTFALMILSIFFTKGETSFAILTLTWTVAWLAYISGIVPLTLAIFPREQYGQISSANAMVYAAAMMVASYGGGLFIDWVGSSTLISQGVSPYVGVFWCGSLCSGLGLFFFMLMYAEWRKVHSARTQA